MSFPTGRDHIYVSNIPLRLSGCKDAWNRPKPQPAILSVRITYPSSLIAQSGATDDVSLTLSYGTLYRNIEEQTAEANGIRDLAHIAGKTGLQLLDGTLDDLRSRVRDVVVEQEYEPQAEVYVQLPKVLLRVGEGLKLRSVMRLKDRYDTREAEILEQEVEMANIQCACIIGVNAHEREQKQIVVVGMRFLMEVDEWTEGTFQDASRAIVEVSSIEFLRTLSLSIIKRILFFNPRVVNTISTGVHYL